MRSDQNKNYLSGGLKKMSTVNESSKAGHPVAGIVLGILGIAVALLMTLMFGVIAGAVAGVLGIGAALLGYSAHKRGNRGVGAIVSGVLALVLAVSMTFTTMGMMKHLKATADASGVAPNFARYMDNPYLGLAGVAANAVEDMKGNDTDVVKTLQGELEALNKYVAHADKPAAENAPVAG